MGTELSLIEIYEYKKFQNITAYNVQHMLNSYLVYVTSLNEIYIYSTYQFSR